MTARISPNPPDDPRFLTPDPWATYTPAATTTAKHRKEDDRD
jgi:hypothetical protein